MSSSPQTPLTLSAYSTNQPSNPSSQVTGWYFDPGTLASDVLQNAYDESLVLLRSTLSAEEYGRIIANSTVLAPSLAISSFVTSTNTTPSAHVVNATPTTQSDINKLLNIVKVRQQQYILSRNSSSASIKARKWLDSLSTHIVYYGNIVDVLVQQHPEYVSLAWGAFKFLFVGITNHAELLSKISKNISRLFSLLPQHSLLLILYPTPALLTTLAHLYASSLRFLTTAIRFYTESRLTHSIKAIFQPWKLRFQDLYDDVAEHSANFNQLTNVAAKAELRDVHLELSESRKASEQMNTQIATMHTHLKGLEALFERKMLEHTALISTLSTEIHLDFSQQKKSIDQIHLNQILSMSFWQNLPSSGESLEYCKSLRNRRLKWSRVVMPHEAELQLWASEPKSSLLAISSQGEIIQKDFLTDMAGLIRSQQLPVIWALRFPDHWNVDLTVADIVRMLVLQALQVDSSALSLGPNPLSLSHLREAADLQDWLRVLDRVLMSVPRIFILLDGDILSQATKADRYEATALMDLLIGKMRTSVKMLVPVSNLVRDRISELQQSGDCTTLAVSGVGGRLGRSRNTRGSRRPDASLKRRAHTNWMTRYAAKRRRV